jgi:hypothetical protein
MSSKSTRSSLRLDALRKQIKAGVAALERGEFTEIADADIKRYLKGLTTAQSRRRREVRKG